VPELHFRLADGDEVMTTDDRELFDALWLAGDRRGAISAAGKVADARALVPRLRGVIELDEHESQRLREVLERMRNGAHE
jgi:hypothetical protein